MHRKQFIILIFLLVIGFASVTTTLILNGNVGIGVELDDFDVIFVEALLDGKEDSKATISSDKKTITFSTDKLSNVGDSARLDYKVKNTSTQYDADVTINCTNEASYYVTVTSEFDGNSTPLISPINMKAQEVKSGYINAELAQAYAGEENYIEISCKIEFTATSREEYAYSLSFNSNGGSKIDDKSIVLNDSYGELAIPEREGYTFLGWYDEEDNKVDSSTIFDTKGNRNLYAKWEEKVYDLNIVTIKDGESKTNTIGITYGNKVQVSINEKNYYISKMECSDGYTIEDYNLVIPTYGEQKPSIKNNKVDKNGSCTFTLEQGIFEYAYTGSEQEFSAPLNGKYKIELWGAQGANYNSGIYGGYGAYSSGNISLKKEKTMYVYVGEAGVNRGVSVSHGVLNFNGASGGNFACYTYHKGTGCYNSYGGSATDIRLVGGTWNDFASLKSRIMVAAGGASANQNEKGAAAGGLIGYSGRTATGGTQVSSGTNKPGGFGYGGIPLYDGTTCNGNVVNGAGSGYYGGATYSATGSMTGSTSSGGGSSFISGHNGCDAISKDSTSSNIIHTGQPNHYSRYVFTDTVMIDGAGYKWTNVKGEQTGMPSHDGTSTMTGNSGNGYAKITLMSID